MLSLSQSSNVSNIKSENVSFDLDDLLKFDLYIVHFAHYQVNFLFVN